MKTLLAMLTMLLPAVAFAQAPAAQPTLSPEVQQLVTQIHATGCNAEEIAAAQTIANLQKQIDLLQKQLKDPPRSGATKH